MEISGGTAAVFSLDNHDVIMAWRSIDLSEPLESHKVVSQEVELTAASMKQNVRFVYESDVSEKVICFYGECMRM